MAARRQSAEEKAFLEKYRPGDYPRPSVTVDLVVMTIIENDLRLLLVKRNEHPFKGSWALPGGFVRVGESATAQGEDVEAAARRELTEETSLSADDVYLEQLFTFGKANRDPRMRVVSVAYYALVRPDLAPLVKPGGDAVEAEWASVRELSKRELAFDHQEIIDTAIERIRGKLEYSDIAFDLVPITFTIPELRHAFGVVLDKVMDPGNFRRKFNGMLAAGFIEKAPGKRQTASKPASVFKFKR